MGKKETKPKTGSCLLPILKQPNEIGMVGIRLYTLDKKKWPWSKKTELKFLTDCLTDPGRLPRIGETIIFQYVIRTSLCPGVFGQTTRRMRHRVIDIQHIYTDNRPLDMPPGILKVGDLLEVIVTPELLDPYTTVPRRRRSKHVERQKK